MPIGKWQPKVGTIDKTIKYAKRGTGIKTSAKSPNSGKITKHVL